MATNTEERPGGSAPTKIIRGEPGQLGRKRSTLHHLKTPEGRAVEAIFADLGDRRFLKWVFDPQGEGQYAIDREVQKEIKAAWRKIIKREFGGAARG